MKSVSTRTKMFLMVAAAMMVFAGVTRSNASLVFENYTTFSGNTGTPLGALTATFENITGGGVTLTLTATGLNAAAKISEWGFNYGGLPTGVTPSVTYSPPGASQATNVYTSRGNQTKADGDGYFNLYFTFPVSGNIFNNGSVVYTISAAGLTEDSFLFLSQDKDGNPTGYYSAAHVQGLPADIKGATSGWVALQPVPLPPSVFLLACGLVGMVGIHRLRKKQSS